MQFKLLYTLFIIMIKEQDSQIVAIFGQKITAKIHLSIIILLLEQRMQDM